MIENMFSIIQYLIFLIIFFVLSKVIAQKSVEQCRKYAEFVNVEDVGIVMTRKSHGKSISSVCGIVEVPLIVGGVEAHPMEFPHMALLGYQDGHNSLVLKWYCGGSLISNSFVLTAAHCLNTHLRKVRFGEVNLDLDNESKIQEKDIKRTYAHPDYNSKTKYNDIALLETDSAVIFDAFVRPACLATSKIVSSSNAIASGFGKTKFDDTEGTKKLMKVSLKIFNNEQCSKYFQVEMTTGVMKDGVTNNMICAGDLKGNKDTCQGDSGGPLQIVLKNPYCMYSIIGVVSFGKFCGFANQPAIYTNVAYYISWIENIVWR